MCIKPLYTTCGHCVNILLQRINTQPGQYVQAGLYCMYPPILGGRGTMALLQLPVTKSGHCLVTPACVGLVTEPRDALLLLEQQAVEPHGECCCHAAFLYATVTVSNILIIDRNSNEHVFMVMTSVLLRMLGIDWLQERTDGISCTNLQARILRSTDLGNAVAAGLRQFKRC